MIYLPALKKKWDLDSENKPKQNCVDTPPSDTHTKRFKVPYAFLLSLSKTAFLCVVVLTRGNRKTSAFELNEQFICTLRSREGNKSRLALFRWWWGGERHFLFIMLHNRELISLPINSQPPTEHLFCNLLLHH